MDFGMPFLLETDSIEECCALARELGLAFVELNANFPACQTGRLSADMLRRLAERYGLYFTFHVEEECDPYTFNPQVRQAWLETMRRTLVFAREMESPVVNMHFPHGVYITLPGERTYLYSKYEAEFQSALTAFREMCEEHLAGSGTRVTIENTDGWLPHEQKAIERLLESPVFGLTMDIGHSHAVGDVDEDFFCCHASRLMHMHGHDARGRSNHLALGDGEIDLVKRFALARRQNARIVLETKTIAALRTSVARLPEFLSEKR